MRKRFRPVTVMLALGGLLCYGLLPAYMYWHQLPAVSAGTASQTLKPTSKAVMAYGAYVLFSYYTNPEQESE